MLQNGNIVVRVAADITNFSRNMRRATTDLDRFQNANRDTFDSFKKVGMAVTGAGLAVATGLGAAVKVASDFESSFAGVNSCPPN